MFFRKKSPLPQPGTHAPEFRLARLEGGEVALADLLAEGPAALAFFKVSLSGVPDDAAVSRSHPRGRWSTRLRYFAE